MPHKILYIDLVETNKSKFPLRLNKLTYAGMRILSFKKFLKYEFY